MLLFGDSYPQLCLPIHCSALILGNGILYLHRRLIHNNDSTEHGKAPNDIAIIITIVLTILVKIIIYSSDKVKSCSQKCLSGCHDSTAWCYNKQQI